jgi:hypothetical protein
MGKIDYIDDKELTKKLLLEIENYKSGKQKTASNDLAVCSLRILERILSRRNFKNYTDDYKDEFRSKAHFLFAKYWHRYEPEKVRKNFYVKDGIKYLKDKSEWQGAFSWFTLLSWTACTDEIKRLNKLKEKRKELFETESSDLKLYDSYPYNSDL